MPLTPKNRKEEWLQGLVDHETTLTPKNRPEEWMKEIIDASGGGGGGGGGVIITTGTYDEDSGNYILDKTFSELKDAYISGAVIIHIVFDEYADVYLTVIAVHTETMENYYDLLVYDWNEGNTTIFHSATPNDYPEGSMT